jgi:hypothetical protein
MISDAQTGENMQDVKEGSVAAQLIEAARRKPTLMMNQFEAWLFAQEGVDLSGYDVHVSQRLPVPPPKPRALTGQPQGPARQRNGRELRRARK